MLSQRLRRWSLRGGLLAVAVFAGTAWHVGSLVVAPAKRSVPIPPSDYLPIQLASLSSESTSSLAAWFIPRPDATATVVLLHPIRGNRLTMLSRAKLLYDAGYSIVLVDLHAHGESSGEHITFGHLERHDVGAAVEFARQKSPEHKIAIIGRSLGGASALLAFPLPIDALVLESVYPTINEATRNRISRWLGPCSHVVAPCLLSQLHFRLGISSTDLRPIDNLAAARCPVLVLAGELDEHTTAAETSRMFDSAVEPKRLVMFPNAAHVDLLRANPELYTKSVLEFLASALRPSPAEIGSNSPSAKK